MTKRALIIGAGPAGLTAALELLRRTDIQPVIFEADHQVGGISKTIVHHNNRMDLGGHRFFSKSDWVMNWWQQILPLHDSATAQPAPEACLLLRPRLSRIYFLRRFFDYPIKMNLGTMRNLGLIRLIRIACSYAYIRCWPRRNETSLEDFIINRFGRELYLTFFKDYTEKVWGVACQAISADWGAQRIKGLSISAALRHAGRQLLQKIMGRSARAAATETSLIEQFLYPRLGPGQMWETVAAQVQQQGGKVELGWRVVGVHHDAQRITGVDLLGPEGQTRYETADYILSTMPIKDLVAGLQPAAPEAIRSISDPLPYRDFMTVGVLVKNFKDQRQLLDNWIYIQEKEVHLGRLQIFNNWCPDLVADANTVWLGLEYFCNEGDALWQKSDADFATMAVQELAQIGLINAVDVLDTHVVRVPKAYPAYFGTYARFDEIRSYLDGFSNLFLMGRNGMHHYNNQDHSMLTAKLAVDAIAAGSLDKSPLWAVNVDDDYHEAKQAEEH